MFWVAFCPKKKSIREKIVHLKSNLCNNNTNNNNNPVSQLAVYGIALDGQPSFNIYGVWLCVFSMRESYKCIILWGGQEFVRGRRIRQGS